MESIMVSGQLQVFPTITGIIQIPSFPEEYETYSGSTNIIPSFFEQNLDTLIEPRDYDFEKGYIANGSWIYQVPTNTYADIYQVQAGNVYFYTLGDSVGSCFRAMFTTQDVTLMTSGRIQGTQLLNLNNPNPYQNGTLSCQEDGYLIIVKDNVGKSGIKSYVYNVTLAWA